MMQAIGDVAKARGMSEIASKSGLGRESRGARTRLGARKSDYMSGFVTYRSFRAAQAPQTRDGVALRREFKGSC